MQRFQVVRDGFKAIAIAFFVLILSFTHGVGQSVEVSQAFLDLTNDAVVMNISAHPDDEDGATLAYYRMKYGVKTYSLLFTRGEGGQNEIGPELYEELGVLRTEETLLAGKILGAEVVFLSLEDFGYSKTASETFRKWGGPREVLRRLVLAIRKYKPDVIFTNHNTIDGHGHHQAVAITAIAAFDAAADSTLFPEQLILPGITVWQPRKLFFRNFGRVDQTADVVNQIGEVNPPRSVTYLDIAVQALNQHKTQGMDRADLRRFTRGLSLYRLVRANSIYARDTTTFLGSIDLWKDQSSSRLLPIRTLLSKLRPGMPQDSLLEIASEAFSQIDLAKPVASTPFEIRTISLWERELERLVATACELSATWKFADSVVVPTQKVASTFLITSRDCKLEGLRYSFSHPQGWAVNEGRGGLTTAPTSLGKAFEVIVGDLVTPTLPKTAAIYNPLETMQDVSILARFLVNGKGVQLRVHPSFDVAPYQLLDVQPQVTRMTRADAAGGRKFTYQLKNFTPRKIAGRISVQVPEGWRGESVSFAISREDSSATGVLTVRPPKDVVPGHYTIRFRSEFSWCDVTVNVFDVEIDKRVKLGIVESYDNTLDAAATELGIPHTRLTAKDLAGDLRSFTTIVVDIRAYLVRDDLRQNNRRLLEYVSNGGHLVVMYQKDQDWKPEYAPYPFRISRRRVTVEEAPVTVLQLGHPLFTSPNTIGENDWEGWIQERGVYFPDDVPEQYTRLISSNDPDEPALTTGYLLAHHGKGSYIYTSYVWYRQLKEFNAGAYRSFINMISYPFYRDGGTK